MYLKFGTIVQQSCIFQENLEIGAPNPVTKVSEIKSLSNVQDKFICSDPGGSRGNKTVKRSPLKAHSFRQAESMH